MKAETKVNATTAAALVEKFGVSLVVIDGSDQTSKFKISDIEAGDNFILMANFPNDAFLKLDGQPVGIYLKDATGSFVDGEWVL